MKFRVLTIGACIMAVASAAPAMAGTINGTEIAGGKYASSKCKAPPAAGLVVRSIKSTNAFAKAAAAHNEYAAAADDYRKCRVEELTADQNTMVSSTQADIDAVVKAVKDEENELLAKKKELEH
ncbi:MAG: hypothetical protein ABWZ40_13540 [Caulobacterales bacterium]